MRVSSAYGRAQKYRENGQPADAMAEALRGLSLLGKLGPERAEHPSGVLVFFLTIMVEELAIELNVPGASVEDLRGAVTFARAMSTKADSESEQFEYQEWIPFLESRLDLYS